MTLIKLWPSAELDAAGPMLRVKGRSREEIVEAVMEIGEQFGIPMDRAEAERLANRAIRRRFRWPAVITAILLAAIVWVAHLSHYPW